MIPNFLGDQDRRIFLKTLGEVCERTGWIIHAYTLMKNHYHWLLETSEPNLVEGMKLVSFKYTGANLTSLSVMDEWMRSSLKNSMK